MQGGYSCGVFPTILAVSDLHANWGWFAWLVRHAPRFDLVCLGGDLCDLFTRRTPVAEQRREALRHLALLAASGVPIAVAEGNHDAIEPGWLGPSPGLESVLWPGFSGQISAAGRRLILTVCPDTYFGSGDVDATVRSLFEFGAAARQREWLPWLVLHHEPPDAAPICAGMIGSACLNDNVACHEPDMVICAHNHGAPFDRAKGGHWHCRMGNTLLVNAGQKPGHRWPCHLLIDGATVIWRAPGHPKESVRIW